MPVCTFPARSAILSKILILSGPQFPQLESGITGWLKRGLLALIPSVRGKTSGLWPTASPQERGIPAQAQGLSGRCSPSTAAWLSWKVPPIGLPTGAWLPPPSELRVEGGCSDAFLLQVPPPGLYLRLCPGPPQLWGIRAGQARVPGPGIWCSPGLPQPCTCLSGLQVGKELGEAAALKSKGMRSRAGERRG